MNIINKTDKDGFTIIESLVAIAILLAAVIGVTSAIQTSISSYIFSKDQIVAFYLAQEGFEQIRNIRDENALNDRHWLSGLSEDASDPCSFGDLCIVDPVVTTVPIKCVGAPAVCPNLRQDDVEGFYGYDGDWSETNFKREILLTEIADDEISISVTITWSKGLTTRQFIARENLLNWH